MCFAEDGDVDAPLHISKLFELAQLCIKFMYELHDFFWEEFNQAKVFFAHINAFWSFFMVDMKESIAFCDDMILKLQLFHIVNNYFSSQREWAGLHGGCGFVWKVGWSWVELSEIELWSLSTRDKLGRVLPWSSVVTNVGFLCSEVVLFRLSTIGIPLFRGCPFQIVHYWEVSLYLCCFP